MLQKDDKIAEGKPWGIWLALVATFALFIMTTGVIYIRFVTTPVTDCGVVVAGNKSLDGYSVVVSRIARGNEITSTLKDSLKAENQYQARFFLSSGTYRVEVWSTEQRQLVAESDFIPPGTRLTLDLNRRFPMSDAGK
jgi:hypothetical protein